MTQYEAIFQRSSVRRFQMKPIDAKVMEQLNYYIQSVSTLHPEASYRIAVVEADREAKTLLKGRFQVEAPYYLVFSAKEHPFAAKNAGFVMEQIVLYLVTKGIATCYLGDTKMPKGSDHYKTMIVIAFGRPASTLYPVRSRRKALSELVCYKEEASLQIRRILEAGRQAPSALNRQPWRFAVYENHIHLFMKESPKLFERWRELQEIDMGIVMVHMALAAEEQWLNWRLQPVADAAECEQKGWRYVATLSLSEQAFPQG